MTATIVAALLATPSFGLLAQTLHDESAALAERAEQIDARVRSELLAAGFAPHASAVGGQVELLAAARDVKLDLLDGPVRCGAPARERLTHAAAIVRAELARYPADFLRTVGLRRVLLCERLREGELVVPSLPNYEHSLLLDADAPDPFLRRLVHHELFHFVDFADDGELGRDAEWDRLNDRWFVYGSGGRFVRDGEAAHFAEDLAGFVSRYATSALEEDKAEVFSFMMTERARLARLAARDAIVAAKIAAVERQLTRVHPAMSTAFRVLD